MCSVVRLVPADGPILEEILGATHVIWNDRLAPAAFRQFYRAQRGTPFGRSRLTRVALVDGTTVLASLKVYDFDARLDGRRCRVCGLGAVFTQPQHRGRGHARTLIERVLDQASRDGQTLALLFSEIGASYYARLGFEAVATQDAVFRVADPPRRGAPATLVRAGDDRDLEAIVSLGDKRSQAFRFHLVRDCALVAYAIARQRLRAGLASEGLRQVLFFVAEEGATAAAYVVIAVEQGTWVIQECGDRDPAGARVGAMLQVLLAREPAERLPVVTGRLPAGLLPPQLSVAETVEPKELMMIRPLTGSAITPPLAPDDVMFWRGDLF